MIYVHMPEKYVSECPQLSLDLREAEKNCSLCNVRNKFLRLTRNRQDNGGRSISERASETDHQGILC